MPGDTSLTWLSRAFSRRMVYHLAFWMVIFLSYDLYLGYVEGQWENAFLFRFPFIFAVCYLNLYYFLPRYYYINRIGIYLFLVIASVLAGNALNLLIMQFLIDTSICPHSYEALWEFTPMNYVFKLLLFFSMAGLTTGIKLSKHHLEQQQRIASIEKEKMAAEMMMLKSQMQPHFFFNTLNNLYALTIKKSDLAPEIVLKLSGLMSYILYESQAEYVPLLKEITHIKNYLDLEALRFGDKLHLNFEISGTPEGRTIHPLILLPFVENSFKHGTFNQLDTITIDIHLTLKERTLLLYVRNPVASGEHSINEKANGGMGLKNVKRRLHLLYGDAFTLTAEREEHHYSVTLEIPVS